MLTKLQKKEHVALGAKHIAASKSVIFADFTGAPTKEINQLKSELRKAGATFKVMKKRLLKIALKDAGIEFDPSTSKAPIAAIFAPEELTSVAAAVYKFSRDLAKKKIEFKVLAAFDKGRNVVVSKEEFTIIAKLPSREVLLAQVMGAMTGPLRAFMYILDQLSKKSSVASAGAETVTDKKAMENKPKVEEAKV